MKLKFSTFDGKCEVLGYERVARKCYSNILRNVNKPETSTKQGKGDETPRYAIRKWVNAML